MQNFENLEALAPHNSIVAIHDVADDMDAKTATSKAETTFHTGEVAPEENAHRGQLADSEWRVNDKELFQRSGEATAYPIYAAPHESAFGTKRTFHD